MKSKNARFTDRLIEDMIINEERENVILDYKSAMALENTPRNKRGISKDVSAFANSAGGHILYGVREENHIPKEVDGTNILLTKKEWLEQVITSNIQPSIENVEVYPVIFSSRPDSVVLVVRIPRSYTAHQAKDYIYYHRYGAESRPMEDYQVKQTMNRGREPILIMKNHEIVPGFVPSSDLTSITHVMNFSVRNNGMHSAKSCIFEFELPPMFTYRHQGDWEALRYDDHSFIARINTNSNTEITLHPGQDFILSGKEHRNRIGLELLLDHLNLNETFRGIYRFFAENMSPVMGEILFTFSDQKVDVSIT